MDDELRQVLEEGVGSLSERIDRLESQVAKVADNLDTRVTRLEAASSRR